MIQLLAIGSTVRMLPELYTFTLTEEQRDIAVEALSIAKEMRDHDDGKAEDVARAFILIRGAGLVPRFSEIPQCDHIEDDVQVNAYMDSVSELVQRLERH